MSETHGAHESLGHVGWAFDRQPHLGRHGSNLDRRPNLGELFAIDKTGEPGWIYGAEDLAGDGLDSFKQQEMSIDIRTAYASTDAQRFWARVYVSDAASPGGNINAYVFIDADKSASTGGSAAATDIDPKLTGDPSGGGYEFCLGVKGAFRSGSGAAAPGRRRT